MAQKPPNERRSLVFSAKKVNTYPTSTRNKLLATEVFRLAELLTQLEESYVRNDLIQLPFSAFESLAKSFGEADVIQALSLMIASGIVGFPYKFYYMGNVFQLFKRLQNFSPRETSEPWRHLVKWREFLSKETFFPLDFDGAPATLLPLDEDYNAMDIISDYFQEEARILARRNDQAWSVWEYWRDPNYNKQVLRAVLSKKEDMNSYTLRHALYAQVRECTQFKPSLGLAIIRKFQARRILDFSAGWGDRLIAAIACDVDRYLGVDPNVRLRKGHMVMIDTLAPPEKRRNFSIIYQPFQSAPLPEPETFDLILTGPPYFDLEMYSESGGQSFVDFPVFADWLVHFLLHSCRRAWDRLEVGGHMALFIEDTSRLRQCEIMNLYIAFALAGSRYRGVIAMLGDARIPRPFWIWQKTSASDPSVAAAAREFAEAHFPEVMERLPQMSSLV